MGQVVRSWSGLKIVWFLTRDYSWPAQVWVGSPHANDMKGVVNEAYLRMKRTSPFHRQSRRAQQKNMDGMEATLVKRKIARSKNDMNAKLE